jgi:Uma2 family endonuclease
VTLPPLVHRERLDQPTFHARYSAMPPEFRAELVDGVVVIRERRVRARHGTTSAALVYALVRYEQYTPGVSVALRVSTILGDADELHPDVSVRLRGGQCCVGEDDLLHGCPDLVCEIVDRETESHDLIAKRSAYDRHGAREYLAVLVHAGRHISFVRRSAGLVEEEPAPDHLWRSRAFPGLWLDPVALLAGDLNRLAVVLEQGVATPAHAAFAAELGGRPIG